MLHHDTEFVASDHTPLGRNLGTELVGPNASSYADIGAKPIGIIVIVMYLKGLLFRPSLPDILIGNPPAG